MNKYEIMFIVRPNIDEEATTKVVKYFEEVLTKNGAKVEETVDYGKRELAYEIEDFKQGHYFYFVAESNSEANNEFTRLAGISEDVIRFMIIKL